jgi:hypothetical protein
LESGFSLDKLRPDSNYYNIIAIKFTTWANNHAVNVRDKSALWRAEAMGFAADDSMPEIIRDFFIEDEQQFQI